MAEALTLKQLEQFSPRELFTLRAMKLNDPDISPQDLLALRTRLLEIEQSRVDQLDPQRGQLETPTFTPLPEVTPIQQVEEPGPYTPRGKDRWAIHDWIRDAPFIGPVVEGLAESAHLAQIGKLEVMPGVPDLERRQQLMQERDVPGMFHQKSAIYPELLAGQLVLHFPI